MSTYTVIVDNVGETYSGDSQVDAQIAWEDAVKLSQEQDNPLSGRSVTLYHEQTMVLRYERLEQ